jgi:hypothetical protein
MTADERRERRQRLKKWKVVFDAVATVRRKLEAWQDIHEECEGHEDATGVAKGALEHIYAELGIIIGEWPGDL